MKQWMFILCASFALTNLEAILPPLYQTASEIKSMMTDEQLGQKLKSGEVIVNIQKNDNGYEITTNQHRIQVNVVYEPPKRPGPSQFKLHFEEPIPL